MLNKLKVTVSREDGSPIWRTASEPDVHFLADDMPFMVVKKDGGAVEVASFGVAGLLEFTIAELDKLETSFREALCESYGLERSGGER